MNEQEKILQELREIKEGIRIVRKTLQGFGMIVLGVLIGTFFGGAGQFVGGLLGVVYTLIYMFADPKESLKYRDDLAKEKQEERNRREAKKKERAE